MAAGNRNNRLWRNKDAYVFAVLSLLSFSFLLFSVRSFIVDFRDMGLSAFSGIRGSIYMVSSAVKQTVMSISELATLRQEYAELAAQLTRYEQLQRNSAEILQENNRLREQLGFSGEIRYRHVPAEIIGRDPDNLFSAFVINKGKREGVSGGMPVVAYQDGVEALAGKVIQAGQFESLVMPVYDAEAYVSARFASSRYEGLVGGRGSQDMPLVMDYIPKRAREELSFGDVIVTSGLRLGGRNGGIYPADITIGRLSRLLYEDYETSMKAEIDPALDFSRLEYVFVIVEIPSDSAGGEING